MMTFSQKQPILSAKLPMWTLVELTNTKGLLTAKNMFLKRLLLEPDEKSERGM